MVESGVEGISLGGGASGGMLRYVVYHFFQVHVPDKWDWKLNTWEGYTVSGVYNLLSNVEHID